MQHTTHGLMTPADLADHQRLTDTGPHPDCPGHEDHFGEPMTCSAAQDCPGDVDALDFYAPDAGAHLRGYGLTVAERICNYQRQTGRERLSPAQRRRMVKKAGRDPQNLISRDDGMGYPPNMQGFKEVTVLPVPISGGPF